VFWLVGFTAGLLVHGVASLIVAAIHALGHVLFGWPLPQLHRPGDTRDRLK
jgi:hypothetical protein